MKKILILVITLALSLSSRNKDFLRAKVKLRHREAQEAQIPLKRLTISPMIRLRAVKMRGKATITTGRRFTMPSAQPIIKTAISFNDREDVGLDAAFALLSGDIDLAFTSAYFNESASSTVPMAYGFFGWTDVAYSESGDTASVTATGQDGTLTHELIYSKGNAAKFRSVSSDGTECTLTICLTDQYWAKSYMSADSEVRAAGYKDGSFYLGTGAGGGTLLSLYDNPNAAADPSFVTGMNKVWELKDGQLTTK